MAERKEAKEGDAISKLADAGEDALRRIVELPRRTANGAISRLEKRLHEVEERLHYLAGRVRAIDPLDGRVAALEKRLEAVEKQQRRTARKASPRAKRSSADRARTPRAAELEQKGPDPGRLNDARPRDLPEQASAQAEGEGERVE